MRKDTIIECRGVARKFVRVADSILEGGKLINCYGDTMTFKQKMDTLRLASEVLSELLVELRKSDDDYIRKYSERHSDVYPKNS